MNLNITVRRQERKSFAMRVTPRGIEVLIPKGMDEDSSRVRDFIRSGLERLSQESAVPLSEELGREDILEMVSRWSEKLSVKVKRIQLRPMSSKWASCSMEGFLTLSVDILQLPRDLVEYIILHELAHLKIPRHGKAFKLLMGSYMPDWQERHRQLSLASQLSGSEN